MPLKHIAAIAVISLLSLVAWSDNNTAFYLQSIRSSDVDRDTKIAYVDSLLSHGYNDMDSLLSKKIGWAYEAGRYGDAIDAFERLKPHIKELGISNECRARLDYIRSLSMNKQYVNSLQSCSELLALAKPDSLIYYDALVYLIINDFMRHTNLPLRENYIGNVERLLNKAEDMHVGAYSKTVIRKALHMMRMKDYINNHNYQKALEEAEYLNNLPMDRIEKEAHKVNIAYIYLLIGQHDAAKKYYAEILEDGKSAYNTGIALVNYTHILNLQGRFQETIDLIKKHESATAGLNKDIYYSHLLGNKAVAESHTSGYEKAYHTLIENKMLEDSLYFNSSVQDGLLMFDYSSKTETIKT